MPATVKAEQMLCPIETATVTQGVDRIVCGNETDLKRCADRADKFRKERDLMIRAADQNHNNWLHCRADLDRARSLGSVEQARTQAIREISLTPPTPPEPDHVPYFIAGAGIGALVGVLATVAVILLSH